MANEQNLKPFTSDQSREEAAKNGKQGGINSGKSRRRKSDMRKAAQDILDGEYTDKNGQSKSGAEIIILNLFKIATDTKNKQAIPAIRLLMELTEQDKSPYDKKRTKAELDLLKAKTALLKGGDETGLKKLDEILKGLENGARADVEQDAE